MPNRSPNFRGGAESVPRVPPFVKATNRKSIKMFNCKFALFRQPELCKQLCKNPHYFCMLAQSVTFFKNFNLVLKNANRL